MYSNDLVCDILDFIDQHINQKITMSMLSQHFYFHKDYIMRLFKKELHTTIIQYINTKRIFQSLYDLQTTNDSILSIGLHHGFSSLEYYSETFHKIMGISPIIYRQFTMRFIDVSNQDIVIIQKHLANVSYFLETITKYQRNRKKDLSYSLSIFR